MLTRTHAPLLAASVLWIVCAAYAAPFVTRGWIAHDEGTIAQSAERALRGEVPHRDFDEVYTGGLSYMHAAAMRLFGVSLLAPRFMLFAFFLAFVAASSAIAWRVSPGWGAAIAVALVVAWSTPNYFASLPSWYTLFFATFGLLAFFRYLDTANRAWLAAAGMCGGLSMLMKITGLYDVVGGLLFLVYLSRTAGGGPRRSWRWLWLVAPVGLLLAMQPRTAWWTVASLQFLPIFLPALGISAFVVWHDRPGDDDPVVDRTPSLLKLTWPFVAGVAIPTGAFLLWYWHVGAAADLVRGLFVLPARRLSEASMEPPPVTTLGLALPYLALLMTRRRAGARWSWRWPTLLALSLGVLLYASRTPIVYRITWSVARSIPLVAVAALAWMLLERPTDASWSSRQRDRAVLLVIMSAFLALVQFPYAAPVYFCYGAPIAVLAVAALVAGQPHAPRYAHVAVALFFLAFAVVFVNRSYAWNLGTAFIPYGPKSRLDLERGGLRVPIADKETYEELVRVLRQHASGGTIYAGPDCPEVYFLAGFENPTRVIFDFLTPERQDVAWTRTLLVRAPIRAVVVNTEPLFSKPFQPAVLAVLEQRFPSSRRVGHFVVRFE